MYPPFKTRSFSCHVRCIGSLANYLMYTCSSCLNASQENVQELGSSSWRLFFKAAVLLKSVFTGLIAWLQGFAVLGAEVLFFFPSVPAKIRLSVCTVKLVLKEVRSSPRIGCISLRQRKHVKKFSKTCQNRSSGIKYDTF